MYKKSEFIKESYKTGEVAKLLCVTNRTIQNYDESGKLRVCRTANNRRCILRDDLLDFLDKHNLLYDDTVAEKRDVIYARVINHEQEESGVLTGQVIHIIENTADLHNVLIIKEVGFANDDGRAELHKLLQLILKGEVNRVFVTAKDRLAEVGYRYLEVIMKANNVEVVVVDGFEITGKPV